MLNPTPPTDELQMDGIATSANDAQIASGTAASVLGEKSGKQNKRKADNFKLSSLRLSMTLKVSLWFGIPLIAGFIALFKLVFDAQQEFQLRQMDDFATVVTDQLAASAVEPLFADAYMELGILVQQIPLNSSLVGVAIADHNSQIVAKNGLVPAKMETIPKVLFENQSSVFLENPILDDDEQNVKLDSVLLFSTPITFRDVTGGHAFVVFDKSSMQERLERTQYALFSIALFMISFLALVVFYFSHRITAPIRSLVDAANRIDGGDISPILERRDDELGQLIKAINNMTQGLAEKSQIKEVLDRFVDPDISNKILNQLDAVDFKGENVDATVVFADIVGFTSLSEKISPDTVSTLLNEYFGYYSACAKLHFGTVDKFLGDCIMIVFGASKGDKQHRYHAACCALLMQEFTDRINKLREQQGLATVHIRIGINSGKMLAGLLGSRDRYEYTVIGDSVNLASRLCNEAKSGEIILPQELCTHLTGNYDVQISESKTIKIRGKSEPVAIFDLQSIARPRTSGDKAMMDDLIERAVNSLTAI